MGKTKYCQKENQNNQKENKGKLKRNIIPNIKNQYIVLKEDRIKDADSLDLKKEFYSKFKAIILFIIVIFLSK